MKNYESTVAKIEIDLLKAKKRLLIIEQQALAIQLDANKQELKQVVDKLKQKQQPPLLN